MGDKIHGVWVYFIGLNENISWTFSDTTFPATSGQFRSPEKDLRKSGFAGAVPLDVIRKLGENTQ